MFTLDVILEILKKFFGSIICYLWKYKGWILLGVILTTLYLRGNNYKEDYQEEVVSHIQTIVKYDKEIDNIKLANEKALRFAQEKSAENYKALVEKTSLIQEKYNERNKDINATINSLNSSNNSLHETIRSYTSITNSSGGTVSDSTASERLSESGKLLEQCIGRKQHYAEESAKLSNSVSTLVEWGNAIIEQNKGEKDGQFK